MIVEVEIDIDDYITDIDTCDLKSELQRRGWKVEKLKNKIPPSDPMYLKKRLLKILGLKSWETKQNIIDAIDYQLL